MRLVRIVERLDDEDQRRILTIVPSQDSDMAM